MHTIYKSRLHLLGAFYVILMLITGCKRQVEINPPKNSITTSQVFADSADAISALAGVYSKLINTGNTLLFGSGAMTVYPGLSADELKSFNTNQLNLQFYNNTLKSTNAYVTTYFWQNVYFYIYQTNSIIEEVNVSSGIANSVKNQITGEAKFFRAFFYFYLTNLFGDVPLVTSTDFKLNLLAVRISQSKVYDQITADLMDAQSLLGDDYSVSGGDRIRVNKWAAKALLARVYLYTQKWSDAETQAGDVINSGLFHLSTSLDSVFLKNSDEAILQFQVNSGLVLSTYNATPEGYILITPTPRPPTFYINTPLLSSFENGDQRKAIWLDSTIYQGAVYFYPFKYKVGSADAASNAPVSEYYMVLRLAEQYLIRAEARLHGNTDLTGAVSDLNAIRNRAGLDDLPSTLTKDEIMDHIIQERRVELFSEWGHRWLDLKRWGLATQVLQPVKSQWQSFQELYPIPFSELGSDPNLRQNPGY